MRTYRHTQFGKVTIYAIAGGVVVALILGFVATPGSFVAVPFLLLIGWIFYSLTIEVNDTELAWRFGPGFIHKRVALSEIHDVRVVRTSFLEGWGIHWSRFGWLYNVSGFSAVAISLRNGKRFALGTDEPQELLKHLPAGNDESRL